jgi:histidyl-tRNA synthetase
MSTAKPQRPKARLPRGFRDRTAAEIAAERKALDTIRAVYQSYGFEPLETPAFEFTDALGKFLPDVDRPNEGVFSLKDDDEQWLSLRYDLTAPLARYVAEHSRTCPSRSAAIRPARSGATRSPAPAATANSPSSMPTRWARTPPPPTPNS